MKISTRKARSQRPTITSTIERQSSHPLSTLNVRLARIRGSEGQKGHAQGTINVRLACIRGSEGQDGYAQSTINVRLAGSLAFVFEYRGWLL